MGFSFTGFIVVIVLLLPNILFAGFPPKNVPEGLKDTNILLTAMERVGQIGFIIIPILSKLYFMDKGPTFALGVMIFSAAVYYGLWIRYFTGGREYSLLVEPVAAIPIPMAVFPIIYMLFAAIWSQHVWLGAAAVIFAAGHCANSWNSYKQSKAAGK